MAQVLAIGIDVGADHSVAAVGGVAATFGASTLVPNEMSNLATPTLCSFQGVYRSVGEPAVGQKGVNPRNTVTALLKLLGTPYSEWSAAADPHIRFETEEGIGGRVACAVDYGGKPTALLPEHLLAMLLIKLLAQAKKQASSDGGAPGATAGEGGNCRWKAVLAVPTAYGPAQKAAVMDAARIAGLFDNGNTCLVVPSESAVASCYSLKHPIPETDAAPRNVVFVDVGDEYVSVAAYRINPGYLAPMRLAARGAAGLGVSSIDKALFNHWADVAARTKGVTIRPGTKSGFRLREAVARARRTLSTGTDARADLDGVGENDMHITLHVTRDELVGLCAGLRAELQSLISSVIAEAGLPAGTAESPLIVELVGGGTRIPFVRDAIAAAAAKGDSHAELATVRLSNMLDGASCVAQGASYMAEAGMVLERHANFVPGGTGDAAVAIERLLKLARSVVPASGISGDGGSSPMEVDGGAGAWARLGDEEIRAAVALEAEMVEADRVADARADARNSLESYVLDLRSRATGGDKHSYLLDADKLLPLLQEAEDWLYDEEGGGATEVAPEKVLAKEASVREQVKDLTAAYYAAVEEDRVKMEAELVAAAAAAEASGEGKEDHDFRKLKKADRMRLVVKNKEEGNELFQGGVWGQAVERYSHALRHCTKFVDLSPDDEKEVVAMKVSLHLNMSMAYLKMATSPNDVDTYKKAAESCTQALALDPANTKALFRRGKANYHIKEYEQARKDLIKAMEQDGADPAIPKLKEQVEAAIKLQAEKEKKMFGKMFG